MPYYRTITVDGAEYEYHVDHAKVVIKGFGTFSMAKWTGWSWDSLERASWKGYPPAIKPAAIAAYIREHT